LLSTHIDQSAISLIIDLGCGTGRFSELLAAHFSAKVIGIEPSQKMLDQARRKLATKNVMYRQATGEALPLPDGCADLVFMSMVYHHFASPIAVARECHRVLRPGGYVCIRNSTREADFPHRHFFPAIRTLVESDLPSRREIESVFTSSGFALGLAQVVTQITAPDWAAFIGKSGLRVDSFLARLSDEDFKDGMNALQTHADEINPAEAITEEIDWFIFIRNSPASISPE
jgi:SAM-dependent methyltransferase